MRENKALGLLISDGEGETLTSLTEKRTIGSILFGGRYRLIDFALSNMVNSGIWDVGVVTHNKYQSLMDHLGNGRDWDLSRKGGGLTIIPPFVNPESGGIYRGGVDYLAAAMSFVRRSQARYIVLSTADIVANIDFDDLIETHVRNRAEITLLYRQTDESDDPGRENLLLTIDENSFVTSAAISDRLPVGCNRYLDTMVMAKSVFEQIVSDLVGRNLPSINKDLIQAAIRTFRIYAQRLEGYCAKIQTLSAYYQANMSLLNDLVRKELFNPNRPILTKVHDSVPAKHGAGSQVKNSLVADGCIIEGQVENSILFRGVKVAQGAVIKNSIIMQGTVVGQKASLDCVIADRDCYIKDGRLLAGFVTYPVVIRKGSIV